MIIQYFDESEKERKSDFNGTLDEQKLTKLKGSLLENNVNFKQNRT